MVKLFDMTAAATGLNERAAKAAGLAYDKVVLSPASHASYYPGGKAMTMKVLYEKGTLRLLARRSSASTAVDKRIDVLATAMQAGMNAVSLKDLDLAYARPIPRPGPVNMAGFMIENLETGKVKQFHYEDIDQLPENITAWTCAPPPNTPAAARTALSNIPVDEPARADRRDRPRKAGVRDVPERAAQLQSPAAYSPSTATIATTSPAATASTRPTARTASART